MKVSIVIPVYNVSQYIRRCIDSVIAQDYTDVIECILIDDCGTDNSIEIAEQIISDYKGHIEFKILHHSQNKGLSAARNTGIEAATGDYLFFIDSDDSITPNCISLLVEEVKKHPDVELVQGYTVSIPDRSLFHTERYANLGYIDDNAWVRKECFKARKRFPCNTWNKLIKTSFIKDNNLTFREGIIFEDLLWLFFVSRYLSKVSIIVEPTYYYYRNENSIMTSSSLALRHESWIVILNEILDNLDEQDIFNPLTQILIQYFRKNGKEQDYAVIYDKLCKIINQYYGPHLEKVFKFSSKTCTTEISRKIIVYTLKVMKIIQNAIY